MHGIEVFYSLITSWACSPKGRTVKAQLSLQGRNKRINRLAASEIVLHGARCLRAAPSRMRMHRPARASHPHARTHPQANGKIKSTRPALTSLTLNPQIAHLPIAIFAAAATTTGLTGWCRWALCSPRATAQPHGFPRGTVKAYPTKQIRFAHNRCLQILLRVCLRVTLRVAGWMRGAGRIFSWISVRDCAWGIWGEILPWAAMSRENFRHQRVSMFRSRVDVRSWGHPFCNLARGAQVMWWFWARDVADALCWRFRLFIEYLGSFVDWERRFSVFAMLGMFQMQFFYCAILLKGRSFLCHVIRRNQPESHFFFG
jgi:hypothetical protein